MSETGTRLLLLGTIPLPGDAEEDLAQCIRKTFGTGEYKVGIYEGDKPVRNYYVTVLEDRKNPPLTRDESDAFRAAITGRLFKTDPEEP